MKYGNFITFLKVNYSLNILILFFSPLEILYKVQSAEAYQKATLECSATIWLDNNCINSYNKV